MAPTNPKMILKSKALHLGIEGFRNMDEATLRAAVADAEKAKNGGSPATPAKAKAEKTRPELKVIQGGKSETPQKAKVAVKKATTKKAEPPKKAAKVTPSKTAAKPAAPTSKPSPAKSSARKSSPAKGAAATGEKAKRSATGATKAAPAKVKTQGDVIRRNTQPGHVGTGGYTNIDLDKIDWTLESKVGTEGKRKDVMDALRRHKGDTAAVFADLRDNAPTWYPNAIKAYPKSPTKLAASERQLRWLIGKVRYDYAFKTGQHAGRAAVREETSKKAPAKAKASSKKTTPTQAATKAAPKKATGTKTTAKKPTKVKTAKTKSAPRKAASAVQKAKASPARRGLAKKG